MAVELWIPEGIEEEHSLVISGGFQYLYARPFKWFSIEVQNDGPDEVKVMVNSVSLPNAVTLDDKEAREFDHKHPSIFQVAFYNDSGKTANITVTTRR